MQSQHQQNDNWSVAWIDGRWVSTGVVPQPSKQVRQLEQFCAKWDNNRDGKLTRQEVDAGLASENPQERAAAETVIMLVGRYLWPREGVPIAQVVGRATGHLEFEKVWNERQAAPNPLPRHVLDGRMPTASEVLLSPMASPLLKFAGRLTSAADKLKGLSSQPGLAHLGPLGNILSGLSNTARVCAGGNPDQVAKDMASAVKNALSLMAKCFPKEATSRLAGAVRVGGKAVPGLGIAVSMADVYLSEKKAIKARGEGREKQALLWEAKAMIDGLTATVQGGALMSAGGGVVSILGRNPTALGASGAGLVAAEGLCVIFSVASEIVAGSISE